MATLGLSGLALQPANSRGPTLSVMATKTDERQHVNAWVEPELVRRLDARAQAAERTRSAEIRIALRQHVERCQRRKEP